MISHRRVARRLAAPALLVLLGVAGPACGDDEPPLAPTPTPLDPATFGRVKGMVRLKGPDPAPRTLSMGTDVCRDFPPRNDPAVGEVKNGLVKNVVVRITKGLEGRVFARPADPVVVDQRGCLFEPRIAWVRPGQFVVFKNGDPTAHNVRIMSQRRATNRTLTTQGTQFPWWFPEAEEAQIPLKCDVHPWMSGYLFVVDHPYVALTDTDGAFSLPDVPEGTYDLKAWSEAFGEAVERGVKVTAGGEAAVTFTFASQ